MTDTTSKPRTSRVYDGPDRPAEASQGGVHQHGGTLPVYVCNACLQEVVWATSKRTGRKYLATVFRTANNASRYYVGADVHSTEKCERRQAERAAIVKAEGW